MLGIEEWYKNGVLHREDGPAVMLTDGYEEYWLNGKEFTKSEWNAYYLNKELPINKEKIKRIKI